MMDPAEAPLHIVVTCTNRKRHPVPPQLRMSNLAHLRPETRFREWITRLAAPAHPRYPAVDLYAGEHWQVAQKLTEVPAAKRAVLWIASAGYGFIAADTAICAYGATFSSSVPDTVGTSLADVTTWWRHLGDWTGPAPGSPRSFADLARRNPKATIIAVLSEAYQRACAEDLLAAAAVLDPEALSVVGPSEAQPQLTDLLVPITATMQHTVGGSLQALNVRVARHLLEHSAGYERTRLREAAVAATPRRPPTPRVAGQRMTDAELRAYIQTQAHTSATNLLRQLRATGRSCEQSRFGLLHAQICRAQGCQRVNRS